MTNKQIKQFVKDRNKAVWSLDAWKMTDFLLKYKHLYSADVIEQFASKDEKFIQGTMAKMCFNIIDTAPEVLEKAQTILDELGWGCDI